MLICGVECQPTSIWQELKLFESSTRPAKVLTDAGPGFIKCPGNPQGPSTLASELIAGELARWFGLHVPSFAIIDRCDISIGMIGHNGVFEPPLFFSKAVDGTPRDGTDIFLKLLRRKSDVARLIVFDTWIRNGDRYVEEQSNWDNLLYSRSESGRRYDLVPIDHSHCFVDGDFDSYLPAVDCIKDEKIYGYYPEFEQFVTANYVADATRDLAKLDRTFVQECVNAVPAEWGLSGSKRPMLIDLICERANYVVHSVAAKLVSDPRMPV